MKRKKLLLYTFISISVFYISCKSDKSTTSFQSTLQSYFNEKNELSPLEATLNGQNKYNDQLVFEMTDSFIKKKMAFFNKYENALTTIDTSSLSDEEKISYHFLQWEIETGKELAKQNSHWMPLNQFRGTHLTMGQFAGGESAQPFKTEKDYQNFLKRMDLYSIWIDSAIVYMRKGIQEKVVLPKALTVKLIPQFEDLVTTNIKDNLFYSSCKKFPSNFSDTQKSKISNLYSSTIQEKLIPQFQKIITFLKSEYLPASRTTSGIGSIQGGKELYKTYVKIATTTNKTPEEIHELGLKEVAILRTEIEKVKKEVGFKGSFVEFLNDTRTNQKLRPYTKPEQVLEHFESIYQTIKPNLDKLFSLQPKTPFQIKRTEAFREQSASAEYVQGSADGTRPGIFYVPVPDAKKYNILEDEDLFLHEAIPGHHFQISLQQENESLPDFRKFNWVDSYGEGWALYTESLGKELGLYKDTYQYLGMLNDEMHRAIRLVVDTGIHSKNWTREQAIQYSLENEAEPKATIIAEIERYMAIPGQALSYKIGQLKIIELKQKAQNYLKDKFDIKVFHEKILESGVMPLDLLEEKINLWIKTQQ